MKRVIFTKQAPDAIGPYSQAMASESMVFTSGQLGIDPNTGELVAGVQAQAELALTHAKSILEQAGTGLDQVIKTTIFLQDMGDFAAVNEIYAKYFSADYPARSCVQVAGLPKAALVEIECIALLP